MPRPLLPLTPAELASRHSISLGAAHLFASSDVIDLHVESYSFYRSFGYDFRAPHGAGLLGGLFFSQADLPRLRETGINGATWVITANPLRPADERAETLKSQFQELKALLTGPEGGAALVRNAPEYRAAVSQGKHACFLGVQGANAFPPDPASLCAHAADLLRITLLHLTPTSWGDSSTPLGRSGGLSELGRDFVRQMDALRIGVDLAHIHPRGFWDAVEEHDSSLPLLVTHTGVKGAHDHWRNLDDDQLRAVAGTGGVIGIMYHSAYLGDPLFSGKISSVVRHIKHALEIVGPEHVALGSDWDGAICTPRDMPTCAELPRLVEGLLVSGVSEETVTKILGANFLRVLTHLKGESE